MAGPLTILLRAMRRKRLLRNVFVPAALAFPVVAVLWLTLPAAADAQAERCEGYPQGVEHTVAEIAHLLSMQFVR